ncbi:MAG: glycosyltransferase family 87 protein [Chloroflexota bacterium]|nr:glycosyltransferase family 87 protein [Chloroflexota bacterium]
MRLAPWLKWGLIVFLCLAVLAGQSWATYRFFTSRFPGANDFYARWANGCALIWTGESPYSEEVTRRAQIGMYGRPARPGEDLAAFSYPLYALFFFWPLCFIRAYPVVQAIWMTLMLYVLLGGLVLTAKVAGWRPRTWLWGVTLVWGVFNYPHARAVILGQMATLVFFGFAASLWALSRNRDWLAGGLLTLTTIKPQMSFLLIPWILWWAAWRRRWEVWKGFGMAMVVLVAVCFLLEPTWLGGFLQDVRHYDVISATDYRSLTWIILRHFLGLRPIVNNLGIAAFSLYALLEAWRGRRAEWGGFLWTTGLMLILTHFIAPRTATTHYTMLLLPLFAWFAWLKQGLLRRTELAVLGVETSLLVGQWVIFLTTLRGDYETALVYLPFPVLMLMVHLLSRRRVERVAS